MKTTQPTYTIDLRVEPREDGDTIRRLRAALNTLKRSYGLACVRIVEAKEVVKSCEITG